MKAVVASCILATACVPKGRHELVEVQLEATRTAMSARTAQGAIDLNAYEAEIDARLAELVRRQLQLDEMAARAALRQAELTRLQEERVELLAAIADLQAQIEALTPEEDEQEDPEEPDEGLDEPTLVAQALDELKQAVTAQYEAQLEAQRVAEAQAADLEAFAALVAEGHATVTAEADATVVRIATGRLFQEGWTTLSPRGEQIVEMLSTGLAQVPGRSVSIEGHTDNRPVYTAEFPTNWERGFSRALAVLRALEGRATPATLSATSIAGTRPIADDATEEGRKANRRVELVIRVDPALLSAFEPTPPEEEEPAPEE